MIGNNNKLEIFESFVVDNNLRRPDKAKSVNTNDILVDGWSFNENNNINGITFSENIRTIDYMRYVYTQNRTIINWFKLQFFEKFLGNKKLKNKDVIVFQSIENFFKEVHEAVRELNINVSSIDFYIDEIEQAVENGQQALVDILARKKNTVVKEVALSVLNNNTKYVEEDDIVKFYEKTKETGKFLKMTWIKNYTRVIPPEVIAQKKEYDKQYIFENYVILHFDKTGDAAQMTEKEKEKVKDPILFGVFRDSRKLYFIGDWVDEYCDLTLDKFLNVLEIKKAKELSLKSIKNEITNSSKIKI